jgi:hypothetical protein
VSDILEHVVRVRGRDEAFDPSMYQEPLLASMALVRADPTSEPASGSVSTIVAPQLRSMPSVAQRRC